MKIATLREVARTNMELTLGASLLLTLLVAAPKQPVGVDPGNLTTANEAAFAPPGVVVRPAAEVTSAARPAVSLAPFGNPLLLAGTAPSAVRGAAVKP